MNVSKYGQTEIAKLLLKKEGIDINFKGIYWGVCMFISIISNITLMFGIDSNSYWTALMLASNFGNTEIVKLLLEQEGIDINAKNAFMFYSWFISKNCNFKIIFDIFSNN